MRLEVHRAFCCKTCAMITCFKKENFICLLGSFGFSGLFRGPKALTPKAQSRISIASISENVVSLKSFKIVIVAARSLKRKTWKTSKGPKTSITSPICMLSPVCLCPLEPSGRISVSEISLSDGSGPQVNIELATELFKTLWTHQICIASNKNFFSERCFCEGFTVCPREFRMIEYSVIRRDNIQQSSAATAALFLAQDVMKNQDTDCTHQLWSCHNVRNASGDIR